MERHRLLSLLICFSTATTIFLTPCDARSPRELRSSPDPKPMKPVIRSTEHLGMDSPDTYSYYNGSPLTMPPYQDVMGPSSSPQENPPYCVYPPPTPLPPSTTLPWPTPPPPPQPPSTTLPTPTVALPPPPSTTLPTTPILPFLSSPPPPPPSTTLPTTPILPLLSSPPPPPLTILPNPPTTPDYEPSPPGSGSSPPTYYPTPLPPIIGLPSPPRRGPSPPLFGPGPPVFLPPVVYPPPTGQPPPRSGTLPGMWCVAKPTVPDPIIMEAMNYACGSGADCDSIQPNGKCYQPDTLIAHASFAFNSYWQRTKVAGGTCDFGGTAMLITKDPSFDGCRFMIS